MPAIKPLTFSKTKDLWRVHQFISSYRQEITIDFLLRFFTTNSRRIQNPAKPHENIKIVVVGISFF